MIENVFFAEFIGTFVLILLGAGVVANVSLKDTIASGQSSWVLITTAWGLAVFTAVFISGQFSGAHLNPAVTLCLAITGKFSWSLVPGYFGAQTLGAMFGSLCNYIFHIDHYKATQDMTTIRGTFCTAPAIRNYKNNLFSEAMGTFMLTFGVLFIAQPNIHIEGVEASFGLGALEALPVGLLVWVIGMSLGGTTGYAINPARDFGPRLIYSFLPIQNKDADWKYAWIPILGPFLGATAAGYLFLSIT
ncbi:MAG: MIP/aquaporin family protein [Flavobacteriaceae bacterium]